jgi:hypothetical protein
MQVREEDEEGFEMNPVEYIRRDTEGSDSDTRRRAAADLVRSLAEQFEGQVAELFTGYVAQLLQVCWDAIIGSNHIWVLWASSRLVARPLTTLFCIYSAGGAGAAGALVPH